MKKALSALLVLWVLLVVIGGIGYMMSLGKDLKGNGPQALTSDSNGGFFLVADRKILHFDSNERLTEHHDFDALGLKDANSLLYESGQLLAYDNERHQIFRCAVPAWRCQPFTTAALGLSDFVSMAWQSQQTLLVADNTNHRLVTLDAAGNLLHAGKAIWHFPNQLMAVPDGLVLADTDRFSILHMTGSNGENAKPLLQTKTRPYQFIHRDTTWWVLQAGASLESATLYRYIDGKPEKISTADDPVSLLDTGSRIIVASRQDWKLLSLNPDSGNAVPVSDSAFQQELGKKRLSMQSAKKQRSRIPFIMLALMLPALAAGVVLQRRMDADAATNPPPAKQLFSAEKPAGIVPERSNASCRIDTDKGRVEMLRAQQNRLFLRIGLIVIPITLLFILLFWLLGNGDANAMKGVMLFISIIVLVPMLLGMLVYLGRRKQDRLFDQHFVCGPQKLVHVKNGKAVAATPYADIWLGSDTLLLKGKSYPLYMGYGKLRSPFWMIHDVQREIGRRIPTSQFFASDYEMGRALLGKKPMLGLRLILARFAVIGVIGLVLVLKLISVLDHLHVFNLWKIFHPR